MSLSQGDLQALQPVLDAVDVAVQRHRRRGLGDVVWLSADFRSLLASTGVDFRLSGLLARQLVVAVLEQTGADGSVIVSAFNFDFPRSHRFDVATTPVQTGAFGQQLLAECHANRSLHPFYSLFVFGKAEAELLGAPLPQSTGPGSVFDWLTAQHTELITVGHHYVKSLSAVHHAEHVAGVPFRYNKQFHGVVCRDGVEQHVDCAFYVRELGVCDFSSLTERGDAEFRRQQLLQVQVVTAGRRPLLVHSINHAPVHQLLVADLYTGAAQWTDYLGPARPNHDVITGERADSLYITELQALAPR